MSEARRPGPIHWVAFVVAAVVYGAIAAFMFFASAFADCISDRACFARQEIFRWELLAGTPLMLVVAAAIEAKWRWCGLCLLFAGLIATFVAPGLLIPS